LVVERVDLKDNMMVASWVELMVQSMVDYLAPLKAVYLVENLEMIVVAMLVYLMVD